MRERVHAMHDDDGNKNVDRRELSSARRSHNARALARAKQTGEKKEERASGRERKRVREERGSRRKLAFTGSEVELSTAGRLFRRRPGKLSKIHPSFCPRRANGRGLFYWACVHLTASYARQLRRTMNVGEEPPLPRPVFTRDHHHPRP